MKNFWLIFFLIFIFACAKTNNQNSNIQQSENSSDSNLTIQTSENQKENIDSETSTIKKDNTVKKSEKTEEKKAERQTQSKITYIQLGSENCPPCRMMKPILERIKKEYHDSGKIELKYYDVWTKAEQHYAEKYKIRVIPTQIFIDAQGKELFRHEGFLAYEQLIEIFKKFGIN
ncbi:MAG TPA: thioredoxin family protein [bacterium]|nr:thioredoxin family protein [bacterium]